MDNRPAYLSDIADSNNPQETLEYYKDKDDKYIKEKKEGGQLTNENPIYEFLDGITIATENTLLDDRKYSSLIIPKGVKVNLKLSLHMYIILGFFLM